MYAMYRRSPGEELTVSETMFRAVSHISAVLGESYAEYKDGSFYWSAISLPERYAVSIGKARDTRFGITIFMEHVEPTTGNMIKAYAISGWAAHQDIAYILH